MTLSKFPKWQPTTFDHAAEYARLFVHKPAPELMRFADGQIHGKGQTSDELAQLVTDHKLNPDRLGVTLKALELLFAGCPVPHAPKTNATFSYLHAFTCAMKLLEYAIYTSEGKQNGNSHVPIMMQLGLYYEYLSAILREPMTSMQLMPEERRAIFYKVDNYEFLLAQKAPVGIPETPNDHVGVLTESHAKITRLLTDYTTLNAQERGNSDATDLGEQIVGEYVNLDARLKLRRNQCTECAKKKNAALAFAFQPPPLSYADSVVKGVVALEHGVRLTYAGLEGHSPPLIDAMSGSDRAALVYWLSLEENRLQNTDITNDKTAAGIAKPENPKGLLITLLNTTTDRAIDGHPNNRPDLRRFRIGSHNVSAFTLHGAVQADPLPSNFDDFLASVLENSRSDRY